MRHSKFLPLAALIAAFWPVWSWICMRAMDDSGDAWELLSLATAVSLLSFMKTANSHGQLAVALPTALLLTYAVTYPFLTPLTRACIAITAVATMCSDIWFDKRMDLPLWGLLLLGLPVIASLNFFLGYPLRVIIGTAAQALLQMNGFAVIREGTLLNWHGRLVSIDAPCSGVKMLWAGLYLSFTLAALLRLDSRCTALLAALAVVIVLFANVMRATALFFVEAEVVVVRETWHSGIGIAVFAFAALAVAVAAQRLKVAAYAA